MAWRDETSGRRSMRNEWKDRVRERAYALWEREGRPEGSAERHWIRTERQLRAEATRIAPKAREVAGAALRPAGAGTGPPRRPLGESMRPSLSGAGPRTPERGRAGPWPPRSGCLSPRASGLALPNVTR